MNQFKISRCFNGRSLYRWVFAKKEGAPVE